LQASCGWVDHGYTHALRGQGLRSFIHLALRLGRPFGRKAPSAWKSTRLIAVSMAPLAPVADP
jgi:hypothetical protein